MFTKTTRENRLLLLSTTSIAGAMMMTANAFAAQAPEVAAVAAAAVQEIDDVDDAADEFQDDDTIVVTGSRIRRSGFDTPQPVTVIDSEAIALSGTASNIGNFLAELPALGSTFTTGNSTRFIGTVGQARLDLRDLGTARTLVLVNGKRHVSQAPGTAVVDVNTIPTDLIERVEVITGGASAIYGADAVTGVVNFILRDDFEGLKFRGQAGTGAQGHFDDWFVSATGGVNFDDGRGNAYLSAEYAVRSSVFARDLDNSIAAGGRTIDCTQAAQDFFGSEFVPDDFITNGGECTLPANAGISFISNAGTFTNGALYSALDAAGFPRAFEPFFAAPIDPDGDGIFESSIPYFTFLPDGTVVQQDTSNFTPDQECFNCDFLDLRSDTQIQPRIERINFSAGLNYEIRPWAEFYINTKYVNTIAESTGQPTFNNGGGAIRIASDNAFASPSLQQFFTDSGIDEIFLQRFNVDLGLRGEENENNTYRIVTGFRGDYENPLTGNDWTYDLSFNYGSTKRNLVALNNRLNQNFLIATDAVFAPDGSIECRVTQQLRDGEDLTAPDGSAVDPSVAARCVPANILGFGNISPAAEAFINVDSLRTDQNTQMVWSGFTTGDLFNLPAGPVGFAMGGEYREETSETRPALEDSLGLTFGNVLQNQDGQFDVWEVFGEISVPVLADFPLAEELTLDAAVRYGDYSTIGGATSYKAGATWSPIEDITFRGVYSIAIRAPNIGELFGPLNQTFFTVTDPCSETDIATLEAAGAAAQAALRRTNCAALGRPAGFESTADDATLPGQQGGNVNLQEERATTYTVGAVMQPRYIPGLQLSADYFNVKIDGGIGVVGAQNILDLCVESPSINNPFCLNITRDPATFEITNILSSAVNFSALEVEGVDYEMLYSFNTNDLFGLVGMDMGTDLGSTTFRVIGTHYMTNRSFPNPADPTDPESILGELGQPKNTLNFTMVQRVGPFTGNYRVRYESNQLAGLDDEDVLANPFEFFPVNTGRIFTHDVSMRYDITDTIGVTAGINNVTNNLPAKYLVSSTGTGAGSGAFSNIGRFYYIGAEVTF
jgi:outer membrane receptor protein involved in Fe transport